MLRVDQALERILAQFSPTSVEQIPLAEAAGRVLAEPILAGTDLPPFDNSSVDGFAVRAEDILSASRATPIALRIVADIPAGSFSERIIHPGEAARIMTGAAMPPGANAVVMLEDSNFYGLPTDNEIPDSVQIFQTIRPGDNIRYRATDLIRGEKVLPSGHRLRAQDVGLLGMLGHARLAVHRKPKVALLSSGDEILSVDAPLAPGKVRDANSYSLAALARQSGCEVLPMGVAPDRADAVRALLDQAVFAQADVIISSAGVSVGAFDFVKDVVESAGALDFWKVNMRPGKPLAFGHYQNVPFFGLPGNPVSAFVGFLVFVQPALEKLCGLQTENRKRVSMILAEGVESDGRESYLRAIAHMEGGQYIARLTGHQGSGNLFSLVQANALLIIPSGVKSLAPGERVDAWLL